MEYLPVPRFLNPTVNLIGNQEEKDRRRDQETRARAVFLGTRKNLHRDLTKKMYFTIPLVKSYCIFNRRPGSNDRSRKRENAKTLFPTGRKNLQWV